MHKTLMNIIEHFCDTKKYYYNLDRGKDLKILVLSKIMMKVKQNRPVSNWRLFHILNMCHSLILK